MRPIVALVTDFGNAGAYVPQIKGAILSIDSDTRILDLSHTIKTHNIFETSYLVQKASSTLPANSIVCALIDPGVKSERPGIAIQTTSGKIYIGPDNGIFSHVLHKEGLTQAVILDRPEFYYKNPPSPTFPGRDIFGPIAAHLASGTSLSEIGTPVGKLMRIDLKAPTKLGNKITGKIVHVDHLGNMITNIHRTHLPEQFEDKLVKVIFHRRTLTLPLVNTYAAAPKKRLFALVNSDQELEVAIRDSSAAKKLKPRIGESIIFILK
ncbi:MAG: SAM-dependent chlorinase/fluorinase [Verrucomicrobiota bacterium]